MAGKMAAENMNLIYLSSAFRYTDEVFSHMKWMTRSSLM